MSGHLLRVLPLELAESLGGDATFEVCLQHERLPIGRSSDHTLLEHAARMKEKWNWDAAVCVTDVPLSGADGGPLVADLNVQSSVAILSLPAFGVPRLRRRVTRVTVQILHQLLPTDRASPSLAGQDLPGPFRLVVPQTNGIDAQVVAARGTWRLLAGMVRDNRPWRLWRGLRRGVIAALAFSVLLLINPTVWELGVRQSSYRLLAIVVCVVAAMVAWLIFYHHLWVSEGDRSDRRQVLLFNASTVVTFALGLSVAFIGLSVVNFAAAGLLLSDDVLARTLGSPPGLVDYLKLSLMATAGAAAIGALGTGFETGEDIREAAYSQREEARGKQWRGMTP